MVNDCQLFSLGAIFRIIEMTFTVVAPTVEIVCSIEDCMGCTSSVSGWYDAGGSTFNYDWYDVGERCLMYGNDFTNFGYTARQACCACGGGN